MTWQEWDELAAGARAVYLSSDERAALADLLERDGFDRVPDERERARDVATIRKGGFTIVLGRKLY